MKHFSTTVDAAEKQIRQALDSLSAVIRLSNTTSIKIDAGAVLWDLADEARERLAELKDELRTEAQEIHEITQSPQITFPGSDSRCAVVTVSPDAPTVTRDLKFSGFREEVLEGLFEKRWCPRRGFAGRVAALKTEDRERLKEYVTFGEQTPRVRFTEQTPRVPDAPESDE